MSSPRVADPSLTVRASDARFKALLTAVKMAQSMDIAERNVGLLARTAVMLDAHQKRGQEETGGGATNVSARPEEEAKGEPSASDVEESERPGGERSASLFSARAVTHGCIPRTR